QGSGSGLVVRDRNGSDSDGLPHWAPPEESEMDQIDSRNSDLADAQLETYVDAINAHVAGFYHLDGNLFVVQGWDCVRAQSTVGSFPISPIGLLTVCRRSTGTISNIRCWTKR